MVIFQYILWISQLKNIHAYISSRFFNYLLLLADKVQLIDAMLSANQDLRHLAMEGTPILVQEISLRLILGIVSVFF